MKTEYKSRVNGCDVIVIKVNGSPKLATVTSEYGARTAEVGLWCDGFSIIDYDGCWEIPSEIVKALEEMGYECEGVA